MQLIPVFTSTENVMKHYSIIFTLIVMYQGLFGGLSMKKQPAVIISVQDNNYFKMFTLFCIAFTATKDIEVSLVSVIIFVLLINGLRTPSERENAGGWFSL